MAEDYVQLAADGSGTKIRTRARTIGANAIEEQYVIVQDEKVVSFQGRASSFITPGRAAVQQRILTLHNVTASTVLVRVNRMVIDLLSTQAVPKLPTIVTPIVRAHRFAGAPTGGTPLTKGARDSALTSNASVVATGDASADGTVSGTALAFTSGAVLAQAYAPRTVISNGTAVPTAPVEWYEPVDTVGFFVGEPDITLRANEGIGITLDAAVTVTGNPATDRWAAFVDWDEYTLP